MNAMLDLRAQSSMQHRLSSYRDFSQHITRRARTHSSLGSDSGQNGTCTGRYTSSCPSLLGDVCDIMRVGSSSRVGVSPSICRYSGKEDSLLEGSVKLKYLDDLLCKLQKEGHRVLLYSGMKRMLDVLENLLRLRYMKFVRLDGSVNVAERSQLVSAFQEDTSIFAFLLTTRAGGVGINLTAADTVIFYDSDWNPTIDAQAMDRAHRIGQQRPVSVYRFVCSGTVEAKVYQRAYEKSTIQRLVYQDTQTVSSS